MNKRHDHRAAAYLLLGVGAAGRAFLAVPEGVSLAELSLTVLMVAGALLLTREGLQALCCGTAALALELALCGSWVQDGGWLPVVLRLVDLWLLMGLAAGALAPARRVMDDLRYTKSTHTMWVAEAVILLAHTVLRAVNLDVPGSAGLATAVSVSFVAFSVVLLWFTVLMVKTSTALRNQN